MKPEETDPKPPEEPAIVQEIRKLVAFDSDDTPGDQCIRCRCGISVQPGDEPTALCHDCAHWVFDHLGVTLSHLDRLASAGTGERERIMAACSVLTGQPAPTNEPDAVAWLEGVALQVAKDFQYETDSLGRARQERDSLRSELATAKRELEQLIEACGGADSFESALRWPNLKMNEIHRLRGELAAWKSTAAKKNDQLIELESARSQPSVSGGRVARVFRELEEAALLAEAASGIGDEVCRAVSRGRSSALKQALAVLDKIFIRPEPSVSAGERPSDDYLVRVYADACEQYTEMDEARSAGRRALFDAGVARGEAKRAAADSIWEERYDVEHARRMELVGASGKLVELCEGVLESLQPTATQAEEKKPPEKCGSCGGTRFVARDERGEYRGPAMIGEDGELCPDCTGEKTMAGRTGSQKDRDARNVAASEAGHPIERLTREEPNARYTLAHRFGPKGEEYSPSTRIGLHCVKWGKQRPDKAFPPTMQEQLDRKWCALLDYLDEAWSEQAERDLALSEQEKKPQPGGGESEPNWRQIQEAAEQILDCVPGYRAERRAGR